MLVTAPPRVARSRRERRRNRLRRTRDRRGPASVREPWSAQWRCWVCSAEQKRSSFNSPRTRSRTSRQRPSSVVLRWSAVVAMEPTIARSAPRATRFDPQPHIQQEPAAPASIPWRKSSFSLSDIAWLRRVVLDDLQEVGARRLGRRVAALNTLLNVDGTTAEHPPRNAGSGARRRGGSSRVGGARRRRNCRLVVVRSVRTTRCEKNRSRDHQRRQQSLHARNRLTRGPVRPENSPRAPKSYTLSLSDSTELGHWKP